MSVCYGNVRGRIYRNSQPVFEPPEPEREPEPGPGPERPDAPAPPAPRRHRVRVAVACSNGRVYGSIREASRATGVSAYRIRRSLDDARCGLLFWDARHLPPKGSG